MGPITSFRDLVSALMRRAGLIVLIIGIGVPLAIWFALSQEKLFEATSVIQIESPRVTETLAGPSALTANNQLDLLEQRLMARDNIMALSDRFDPFPPDLSMTQQVGLLRSAITIVKLVDPSLAWRPDIQPTGLSITVRLADPQIAADLANAMVDIVVTETRERTEERTSRTLDFLVAEETRIAAEIAILETRISDFRQANVASLPEGLTAQRERLLDLGESQLAIEQEILSLQSSNDRLRPEEVARQIDLLQQQSGLITENIALTQSAIAATPAVEQQLGAMNRDLGQLEAESAVITTRRTEAAMSQLLESQDQAARFVVLETAIVPEFAVSASRRKLAAVGAIVAGIVAVGLALALEVLNPAIRTAEQMQRELGIQPAIVIPVLHAPRRAGGGWRWGLAAGLGAMAAAGWAAFKTGLLDPVLGLWPRVHHDKRVVS